MRPWGTSISSGVASRLTDISLNEITHNLPIHSNALFSSGHKTTHTRQTPYASSSYRSLASSCLHLLISPYPPTNSCVSKKRSGLSLNRLRTVRRDSSCDTVGPKVCSHFILAPLQSSARGLTCSVQLSSHTLRRCAAASPFFPFLIQTIRTRHFFRTREAFVARIRPSATFSKNDLLYRIVQDCSILLFYSQIFITTFTFL